MYDINHVKIRSHLAISLQILVLWFTQLCMCHVNNQDVVIYLKGNVNNGRLMCAWLLERFCLGIKVAVNWKLWC